MRLPTIGYVEYKCKVAEKDRGVDLVLLKNRKCECNANCVSSKLMLLRSSCSSEGFCRQKYILIACIHILDKNQVHRMLKLALTKRLIMSISRKTCCGLDVHKETIFAAINANGKAGEVKEYSTLTNQVKA